MTVTRPIKWPVQCLIDTTARRWLKLKISIPSSIILRGIWTKFIMLKLLERPIGAVSFILQSAGAPLPTPVSSSEKCLFRQMMVVLSCVVNVIKRFRIIGSWIITCKHIRKKIFSKNIIEWMLCRSLSSLGLVLLVLKLEKVIVAAVLAQSLKILS